MSAKSIASLRLPVPSVLVVGDYRKSDGSNPFAKLAWQRIAEAYKGEGSSFGAPPKFSSRAVQNWTNPETLKVTETDRTAGPVLYPFPVSDNDKAHSQDFRDYLFTCLYHLDVCAVISCGTARNTKALLKVLEGIDVPIFITIDSTVAERAWVGSNILRLIPNNALQAQAILGKVRTWLEATPSLDVEVFYDSHDDYVLDVDSALSSISQEASSYTELIKVTDAGRLKSREIPGLVICVGYYQTLEKLMQTVKPGTKVIMSDGCYDERVRELIKQQQQQESYFWTHTLSEAAEYAEDAYRAVCSIWQEFRQRESIFLDPKERLISFTSCVRNKLEMQFPARYKFLGSNNQRGGYIVESVHRGSAPKVQNRRGK